MPTNSPGTGFQIEGWKVAKGISTALVWLLVLSMLALGLFIVYNPLQTYDITLLIAVIILAGLAGVVNVLKS